MYIAIKLSNVHNLTDDTNLLYISKSVKKLNKFVNFDLKNFSNLLNANKISLNISETKGIIFKPKIEKKNFFDLTLKVNGKKLYPTKSLKYLGIKIDASLTCIEHIKDIAITLR